MPGPLFMNIPLKHFSDSAGSHWKIGDNLPPGNIEDIGDNLPPGNIEDIGDIGEYEFHPKEPTLTEVLKKIEELNRKVDFIFGDHVLLNGRFLSLAQIK